MKKQIGRLALFVLLIINLFSCNAETAAIEDQQMGSEIVENFEDVEKFSAVLVLPEVDCDGERCF